MEKDRSTIQKTTRFKVYPKSERVNEYETEIIKSNTKGPRLVHDMVLNYTDIFYHVDTIQTKNLHRPLEKLKLSNGLYIYLPEADISSDVILQNFSQKLKSLSSLQILKLQIPYAGRISLKGVEHLASALTQMKRLEKLIMNFDCAGWVNDESLHLLFKTLKKYTNLQSFALSIPYCQNVTEKTFKHLASTLKRPPQSLKELYLDLAYLNLIEGNALDFLASGLVNLKSLETLSIHLTKLQIRSADKFSPFMCSIKHLKSLRVFDLNFSWIPIDASTLKLLATSFENLKHLHTLSLTLSLCHFPKKIQGPIGKQNNLNRNVFHIYDSPIPEKSLKIVVFPSEIGHATGKGLIGYYSTFITQEMEVLAQCLQSIAPSLKSLTLDFSYSSSMNDQALEKLSVGLKTLTNLSEINLRCEKCPNIGNPGVESIVYELGDLPNLSSVILNFHDCHPIKNAYYNGLKMKKNIKNLVFRF